MDALSEKFQVNVDIGEFLIPSSEDPSCKDPAPSDIFSSPHSNSFVDLDGDCMPDIFLQKQAVKSNILGKNVYENYYEIYVQKIHKGKQMFCLKDQ
jgi:hypothetical protein